ncbi:hypothetical protein HDU78_002675 [Chytriomyces hyalinus]|nr:hypothetical protein HDU78_002675 [Chytriomyces hyalinus]
MDTSSAVSKANAFAAAAESYTDAGQFAQAIEAHFRAAEQFLLATAVASDPESRRTLRMLFANHTYKGKALQRRHSTTNSSTNGGDKIASSDNSQPAKAFSATTTSATTGPPRTANLSGFTPAAATVPEASNIHISHAVKSTESNSSAAKKRHSGPSPPVAASVSKSNPITNYTRSNPPSPSNSPASNLWSNTFEGTDALSGYGSQLLLAATNQNPNFSDPSTATPATVPVESLDASVFGRSPAAASSASLQHGLKNSPNLAAVNQAKATTRAPLNATQFMPENIDNSYYLLEDAQGNPISTDSDQPEDATPFDKFWDVVESLVQKISISTSAPLQAMQQQAWNPSSMPMPASSTGSHSSSGIKGTSIPGRPGYAPSVGSSKGPSPQMFENLKGFKSPPNHPAMTSISSGSLAPQNQQYQQQQQMPHSKLSPSSSIANANMLNSYFVVPSNTFNSSSGVAASYLGGTGANGYDPNHVYPDGVDVRLDGGGGGGGGGGRGGGAVSMDGVDNSEYSRGMGGGPSMNAAGGLSLPRKMRAVGETRNSVAARGKTYEELQLENEQLKQTVDFLAKRVSVLDKAAEENNMLKSSIIQFRQDIQKQAKRFGVPSNAGPHFSHLPPPRHNSSESNHGRQLSPTSSSVMNQSQMSLPGGTGEASKTKHGQGSGSLTAEVQDQLYSKVNRLELELNTLKEQYDQQEQELAKYKEKWIKAKDSARKKKELKTATTGLAASALMLEDSAPTAEGLGGQGSGGGSGSGRGDLGSIDGSMTFSVYGKDGDGAGSTPSSDTPASPTKENEADPSINPHPLSLETVSSSYEATRGPDLDAEESEFKIFSPSQGNTPLASAIGFQLPPQEQASLSRPAVTPQYNSVTPTMVAASLSTSVVVDASAALLSSHLRDPATSRSAPAFTGNLMSASIGVGSTKSSPASGRGGSGTAISIQNVSLLQKGNETGSGRPSDDSATPSAPPPDLAESSVSGGSMFYSATFQ